MGNAGKAVVIGAVVGTAALGLALALITKGPPGGSYNVPFTVDLTYGAGISLPGQTVLVAIEGTSYTTSVLTLSDGTAAGDFTGISLTAGQTYTLSGTYAGGTVDGVPYEASYNTTFFVPSLTAMPVSLSVGPVLPDRMKAMVVSCPGGTLSGLSINVSPTAGQTGQTITFEAVASGGTAPYDYAWTFGDGGSASTATATHAYGSGGTFTWECAASDSSSQVKCKTVTGTIVITAPTVITVTASASPNPCLAGNTVTGSASASGGTAPYTYAWTWGDGGTGSGTAPTHVYEYPTQGNLTVTVTATDAGGHQGSKTFTETVGAADPVPTGSTVSPTSVNVGQTVTVTCKGADGTSPYTYLIAWGDGTTSSASDSSPSKTHSYTAAGAYTVEVEVMDSAGYTGSYVVIGTVTVVAPAAPTVLDLTYTGG